MIVSQFVSSIKLTVTTDKRSKMWNCATKSLRKLIVTSVTLCVIVIYVKWCMTISSYKEYHQPPYSNNISKDNSKAADEDLYSGSARMSDVGNTTHNGNASNKRNIFETLLKSKPRRYEVISLNTGDMNTTKNNSDSGAFYKSPVVYKNATPWYKRIFQDDISVKEEKTRIPYFHTFEKSAYDILNMDPIAFDSAFKNPCWRGKDSFSPSKDEKLYCLPSFYVAGVKKSGTTDFYSRLQAHPDYCRPLFWKESQWLAKLRFGIKRLTKNKFQDIIRGGIDPRKIEFFVSLFDVAAMCISCHPTRRNNDVAYYKKVTAEASPTTFHMHTYWELLPGNENLTEPRYTNFHYIKHITPKSKIIILFRDPTTRLYSDFLHTTHGKHDRSSPYVFHSQVAQLLEAYKRCFHHFSQRRCVYNNALKMELLSKRIELAESFNAGFYAIFTKDLLAVFGKAQMLPILFNDYVTNMEETLRNAFKFLNMSTVSSKTMQRILQMSSKNVSERKRTFGPMLDETRDMLYDFYRPYNEDMTALMNNTRYLFPKYSATKSVNKDFSN